MDDTFIGTLTITAFLEIPATVLHPASTRKVTLARIPCEYGNRHITLDDFRKANPTIKIWLEADWCYKSPV